MKLEINIFLDEAAFATFKLIVRMTTIRQKITKRDELHISFCYFLTDIKASESPDSLFKS